MSRISCRGAPSRLCRAEIVKIPVAISIITNAVVLPVFSQTSTAQTCINGA